MKTIVFTPRAARQLDKLPATAREEILDGLAKSAIGGVGDVKKLRDRAGCRLRVGSYRVIFEEDQVTVLTIEIVRRTSQTYKRR